MSNRRPSRIRPLNTLERLALCYVLNQNIDELLDIYYSRDVLTATIGPPPPEIKAALDIQISSFIETIFSEAAQA